MKRISSLFNVKQGKIEEYKGRYASVRPEMQSALRRSGWHNYPLFMLPDGLLFG